MVTAAPSSVSSPRPFPALTSQAARCSPSLHFRAPGRGPLWLFPLGVRGRLEGRARLLQKGSGVCSRPSSSSNLGTPTEIQSAAAFSDPPFSIPGGLHSTPPANTAVETNGQSMAICILFKYLPKHPEPSRVCPDRQSPRCPSRGPRPHWLGFTSVF
jgi:hypothetical protein